MRSSRCSRPACRAGVAVEAAAADLKENQQPPSVAAAVGVSANEGHSRFPYCYCRYHASVSPV